MNYQYHARFHIDHDLQLEQNLEPPLNLNLPATKINCMPQKQLILQQYAIKQSTCILAIAAVTIETAYLFVAGFVSLLTTTFSLASTEPCFMHLYPRSGGDGLLKDYMLIGNLLLI